MLHDFLLSNRDEIVARAECRWTERVSAASARPELDKGIPLFLDQLTRVLGGDTPSEAPSSTRLALARGATANGEDLLRRGSTVEDLVRAYGDVCQVVTQLATEQAVPISTEEFKAFNGCLDDATAHAVVEYVAQRERSLAIADTERLGVLAHEMRNHLSAAILSFESIRSGQVGVSGRTSEVHARSLLRLRDLIDRSLAEVRLDAGLSAVEEFSAAELLEDIEVTASLHAKTRGLHLLVVPPARELRLRGDRHLLAAVVSNLVHNAIKFSRPAGHVSIRTSAVGARILIDVEDECGGLASDKLEELFVPFSQQGADRSGLGLGHAICQRGAVANGGEVRVRNLPGKGCVFTLDLPRCP
jgi:signal transduction histidine kinase